MDWLISPWNWMVFGLVLIALELVLPGLVSVFLGLGALVTAAFLNQGWVSTVEGAMVSFFAASTFLLLFVRAWVGRFLPATRIISETDEVKLALYQRVKVIEAIPPGGEGRISFQESTWKARFASGSRDGAPVGSEVTLLGQDNITYIVGHEPGDHSRSASSQKGDSNS